MDDVIINKGVPKNEADFLVECVHFITEYIMESSKVSDEKFPNFPSAIFIGNLLVNCVVNVLIKGCPQNDFKTFNGFCEVFIDRFIHCKNTIILHASNAEGGVQ